MMDLRGAPTQMIRKARAYLVQENARWPARLKRLPQEMVPTHGKNPPLEVWRSRFFFVQIYAVPDRPDMERISVNRCAIKGDGHWEENITWDELQSLKEQCGRGALDAVEIYPREGDEVNVANMRHLWVFNSERIPWAWRSKSRR